MCQPDGREDPLNNVREQQPGSFLHLLGDDIKPVIEANEKTRLRLPLLFGIDAIHGHSFWPGATIFPTQLTLAASWNPELIRMSAEITRKEMMFTGIHWTFSPVLCITRDLRWGRVGETFGEDGRLIGEFAAAMIQGYQGDDLTKGVLATAKHYAGYSETQGGRDASEADLSRRKMLCFFMPPFRKAAESGAGSFMTGYQSIEGQPSTANGWLLREVLKEEWGFEGILVTDWDNVGRMVYEQKVFADYVEAAAAAIKAGNDMIMATPQFFDAAIEAVRSELVEESLVDDAVRRILRMKFALGLFDDPRSPDVDRANVIAGSKEHRAVALEAAEQSIVLLRNDGILPLDSSTKIALVGPNADDPLAQLGDWSLGTGQANNKNGAQHPRETVITIRDGVEAVFDTVRYARGCRIIADDGQNPDSGLELIPEAVEKAEDSDLVVAVIGDQLIYYGEYKSTATLELMGGQKALLDALLATDKPLVLIIQSYKPLVLPELVLVKARAVVWAGCPGMLGGQALAEILAGIVEPSGRLTVSWPKHVGQQPIYYSQIRGQHGDRYADLDQTPLFAFGEGLGYSTVNYSNLKIEQGNIKADDAVNVSIQVRNTGTRPIIETVQAYVSDLVTCVTWVNLSLAAYSRVNLEPDESKTVYLTIPADAMELVDLDGRRIIEAGEFEVRVGPNSRMETHLVAKFSVV